MANQGSDRARALAEGLGVVRIQKTLEECNERLVPEGLRLGREDVLDLQTARTDALGDAGLIEVGGGILPDLAASFASSPFLNQGSLVQALASLQEAFYEMRRQVGPECSDDDLLDAMRLVFDGEARGSVELLSAMCAQDLLDAADRDGYEFERAEVPDSPLPQPWSEDRWVDSFEADGWDGEKWAADHDR